MIWNNGVQGEIALTMASNLTESFRQTLDAQVYVSGESEVSRRMIV